MSYQPTDDSVLQRWLRGQEFMRFTLTYDGSLPSKGGPADKAAIREQFHPQLVRLWQEHPALKEVFENRYYPTGKFIQVQQHHSSGATTTTSTTTTLTEEHRDLLTPVVVEKASFFPLVRESLSLKCALKVLVLRQTPPGGVLDNGDIDNRLKTLFDALSVPHKGQEQACPTAALDEPIYTLLENDRDVLSLEIDTRQLLTHEDAADAYVRLIIDVETRITLARAYNQPFLGG